MNADTRATNGYTRRLELLAGRVKPEKLFSGEGLVHFHEVQRDIFELQMDLQREIRKAKQRKRGGESRSHLETLRRLRWYARRLGDAVAWSTLLQNRQVIQSLSDNDPVPIPIEWSDGHRGAFEFAKNSTSREWGIPIIHDITSVLRIGDVTFTLPSQSGKSSDAIFRTVELKTTRLSESVGEDGKSAIEIQVTIIGNEPLPSPRVSESEEEPPRAPIRSRRPDRRIQRQMERMDRATASKNAPLHEYTKIGEQYHFSLQLNDEEQPHWAELRRAIRAARRDGYAYFELGRFVGYSLFYNPTAVTKDDIVASPMPARVAGLMHEETKDRNSITVSHLPDDEEDNWSAHVQPFYLWDIPQRAIRDILRNRLLITATYNSGWMEKLLTDAGLKVVLDDSGNDVRSFKVVAHFEWEGQAAVEYHSSVWQQMHVAVHEFRGPIAVVQRASAIQSAPSIVSFDKFIPSEDELDFTDVGVTDQT